MQMKTKIIQKWEGGTKGEGEVEDKREKKH